MQLTSVVNFPFIENRRPHTYTATRSRDAPGDHGERSSVRGKCIGSLQGSSSFSVRNGSWWQRWSKFLDGELRLTCANYCPLI